MKLVDQDVPADLRKLYDAYVSPAKANGQPQTKARTKRGAKLAQRPAKRAKRTRSDIYRPTAEAMPYYAGIAQDDPKHAPFIAARLAEMLRLATPSDYWDDAKKVTTRYLTAYPSSAPREQAPNYLYPDPENRPSIPTYGNGIADAEDEGYSGRTIDGMFRDIFWSWEDHLFKLAEPLDMERPTPLLIQAEVEIGAYADSRPSRPMFSVNMKVDFYKTIPDIAADPTPPIKKTWTAYMKFKPPPSDGGTYYHQETRQILWAPRDRAPLRGAQFVRVRIAQRPMFGTGYNNNHAVDTSASILLKVKQRKINVQDYSRPVFDPGGATLQSLSPTLEEIIPIPIAPWSDPVSMVTHGMFVPAYGQNGMFVSLPELNYDYLDNFEQFHFIGPGATGMLNISPFILQPDGAPPWAALESTSYLGMGDFYEYGLNSDLGQIKVRTTGRMLGEMLLCTDGSAMNQHLGSRYSPAIDLADSKPIAWAGGAYMQAADGQWWRFECPLDYGGNWMQFDSFRAWHPTKKLGDKALISLEAIGTGRGIVWPSGKPAPSDYYLLTWNGDLQLITLPPVDWSTYRGQL